MRVPMTCLCCPQARASSLARMPSARRSDYTTLMVEALADNAAPESGALYGALDMPFAVLVSQISAAHRQPPRSRRPPTSGAQRRPEATHT